MSIFGHLLEDLGGWLRRFWNQPNRSFRNFQLVFSFLTLHFFIPSLTYAFNPQAAIDQFRWMGAIFGVTYAYAEDGFVWRILAAGNVCTLAFMCFLLQLNVRRFYAVLVPLCFMKGFAALGFLVTFLFVYRYPPFLGVAVWDSINVLMFLYFAHTARWGLEEWGEDAAVPRLFFNPEK